MSYSESAISRLGLYPLVDYPAGHTNRSNLRAVWTGEYRQPREGEWYLSGAIVEAYQARGDYFESKYPIAKIVVVETTITITWLEEA